MAEKIMGIEIGHKTIKLIETTQKAATLKVEQFSLLETPADCIENGIITNMESVYKLLNEEIKNKKYRSKKVVMVVQSHNIIIRNFIMESQPEKVVKQLLTLKPEAYLPVEARDYQVDFKIVRQIEDAHEKKMETLLVAAPNNIVIPLLNLAESLKLKPIRMTIPSEALGRVLHPDCCMLPEPEKESLVIDIGGEYTTATIISKGEAILTRMIDFGIDTVRNVISGVEEGEKKKEMGSEDKEEYERYIREVIKPQIEYSIISELERILQFYYSRFENGPIKKVYLIGGGAKVPGIKSYIQNALTIQTEALKTFSTVITSTGIDFETYSNFFVNLLGAINGI